MEVASILSLFSKNKLGVNSPWHITAIGIVTKLLLAHLAAMVFYQAETIQQFGFASMSVIALLSGHMSLNEFQKVALGDKE